MTRYLASRFAGMAVVMLLVATLVFFLTRLAPGDPAAVMLGEQATAEDIAQCAPRTAWTSRCPCSSATGCASWRRATSASRSSCSGRSRRRCWERAEPTLLLTLFAIAIATLIGVPCGIVSAV